MNPHTKVWRDKWAHLQSPFVAPKHLANPKQSTNSSIIINLLYDMSLVCPWHESICNWIEQKRPLITSPGHL